jgi:hypothetical protein
MPPFLVTVPRHICCLRACFARRDLRHSSAVKIVATSVFSPAPLITSNKIKLRTRSLIQGLAVTAPSAPFVRLIDAIDRRQCGTG